MKQKSVMSHNFSQIESAGVQRSSFDRSHGYKTTFDSANIIPILVDEALPGDTYNVNMTGFARLATPIFPVMDNMWMDTFFFAVPIRLIWDNWQKFNGEQVDPDDSIDFTVPQMASTPTTGYANESLSDYLGIPTKVPDLIHGSLWHRAYNLIYNEWFRDQNLQDSIVVDKGDGPDTETDYVIKKRSKRHDYFTSCLPWPQKGDPVLLPIGSSAPVTGIGTQGNFGLSNSSTDETDGTAPEVYLKYRTDPMDVEEDPLNTGFPNIRADLSEATAATINQLRQAFQIQKLLERDARGGTRYTEIIRAHFGVVSPDARLQRPEYLGGGSTPVNVTPVQQTSSTDGTSPQGNLAGFGTATLLNHGFVKSFTEHCVILGLISVRADLNYQQGLSRMFSRLTRYDFFWPELAHIGEQAVLNKEIFAQGSDDAVADAAVFGYQERYAEYRYKPSQVTGKFRSNDALSLDAWHLAQDFPSLPVLNTNFIVEDPPIDRIVAIPSEPEFLFDAYFSMRCARPMPLFGTPGLIDHF